MVSDAAGFSELSPFYHTSNDRVSTLHLSFYYRMTRFLMGLTASKAGVISNSNCSVINSSQNLLLDNMEVYPNPASQNIHIKLLAQQQFNGTLQILTSTGNIVYQEEVNQKLTTIDISLFSKGIYFIKIQNEHQSLVKKISII